MNPEKFARNLSIVTSVGLFARSWGEMILPQRRGAERGREEHLGDVLVRFRPDCEVQL
jgi:hypothetical protein